MTSRKMIKMPGRSGPMARSAEDLRIMLEVIGGRVPAEAGGEQHELGAVINLHFCADDKFEAVFFRGLMRAHHAGERTFIGDGERAVTQRLRARDQLFGV